MKQVKNLNLLYLISVVLTLIYSFGASLLKSQNISLPFIINVIFAQCMIALPGLIYLLLFSKRNGIDVQFNKIKIANVFILIVYTELLLPLMSSVNVFSQIFTENVMVSASEQMFEMSIPVMFLIVGVLAPFCEELVFRGIIFFGLRKASHRVIASALVSGLFFGLLHFNLNQFCYAFLLGLVFAVTDEVLGSIWPSIIMHCVINSQNVLLICLMDLVVKMQGTSLSEAYSQAYNGPEGKTVVIIMGIVLFAVAIVTTSIAVIILYAMSAIQGREKIFVSIFTLKKKNTEKDTEEMDNDTVKTVEENKEENKEDKKIPIITVAGYIAIVIGFFVIFLLDPLTKLLNIAE